jgi:hypothetical protein
MLFSVAFGVPEKSVFTRLFCVFATDMLANFQDRLVMTTSISLRTDALYHKYGVLSRVPGKKAVKYPGTRKEGYEKKAARYGDAFFGWVTGSSGHGRYP